MPEFKNLVVSDGLLSGVLSEDIIIMVFHSNANHPLVDSLTLYDEVQVELV